MKYKETILKEVSVDLKITLIIADSVEEWQRTSDQKPYKGKKQKNKNKENMEWKI